MQPRSGDPCQPRAQPWESVSKVVFAAQPWVAKLHTHRRDHYTIAAVPIVSPLRGWLFVVRVCNPGLRPGLAWVGPSGLRIRTVCVAFVFP
jgi:hypothetical protein